MYHRIHLREFLSIMIVSIDVLHFGIKLSLGGRFFYYVDSAIHARTDSEFKFFKIPNISNYS